MDIQVILTQMCVIVIMMAFGFFCKKKGFVHHAGLKDISWIIVNICGPAQILSAVVNAEALPGRAEVVRFLLFSLLFYAVLCLLGLVMGPLVRAPRKDWKFFNMMTIFGNVGFLGLPLGQAIYGSAAAVYIGIIVIAYNIFFYTYGFYVLRPENRRSAGISLKNFINPGFIVDIISVILLITQLPTPALVNAAALYASNAVTFCAVFVIGANLADVALSGIIKKKQNILFLLIRQLAVPIVFVLILKQFVHDPAILGALAVCVSVPVGNSPSMVAGTNGLDLTALTENTVLTTALCVVTMTITMMVAL